ncbi:MAG: hypothetical protein WC028_25505 [Candidatus Obscuribacterales bacterium]|jgi:hypothetical protein
MANEIERTADSTVNTQSENTTASARENLTQLALTLYPCKNGSLVTNPRHCTEPVGNLSSRSTLPPLTIG